ncbi:FG-GAP-like repeat-containing protein [Streptomyces sp. NPDC002516]
MSFDDAATGPAPGGDPEGSAGEVGSGRHKRRRPRIIRALGAVVAVAAMVATGIYVVGTAQATSPFTPVFNMSGTPFGTADWDGDGHPDVIVRNDVTNDLVLYPGSGGRGEMTVAPVSIGSGWNGFTPFGVADFNGDHHPDVIARQDYALNGTAAGSLWLYPGNGARAPMNQNLRTSILSGWNDFTPFGVADWDSDGHPDILARQDYAGNGDPANGLYWYRGNGTTVGVRKPIQSGWNGFTPFGVADFNKDGNPDVIARQDYAGNGDSADHLYMYPGDGVTAGARTKIDGQSWHDIKPFGVTDWDIDGNQDVIARQDFRWGGVLPGSLWMYPGNGTAFNQRAALVTNSYTITRRVDQSTFVGAVQIPNAVVTVAVDLDLSGYFDVPVAPGVQIIGDRTSNPKGPRLFTTSFPRRLLTIGQGAPADKVRISGIRLDGGQTNPTESAGLSNDSDAITVFSSTNVEIDHVELYHWRGTAVNIQDPDNRLNASNASAVWVHDDFIHDNQHPTYDGSNPAGSGHGAGYGINVNEGAYALIERNVFDSNRHSITSDGKPGSGYLAYRNLFLNFGIGSVRDGAAFATQQIDVHGRNSDCGPLKGGYECGIAGEYFDFAYNTVAATASVASSVHLRGTPIVGMDTENNVFAQSSDTAVTFNETGYHDNGGNVFSSTAFQDRGACDFDGDGTNDPFMATGSTWWYASSRLGGNWAYLNQSTKRVADVTLADVNGDGRCDVTVKSSGQQFITTDDVVAPASLSGLPVPDVRYKTSAAANTALTTAGYSVTTSPYVDYSCSLTPGSVAVQDQFGIAPVVRRGPKPKVNIQIVEWPQCQS